MLLMVGILSFTSACSESDGQRSCNPEYSISASINVNLPLYSNLENVGWTYVGGQGTGTRGIVVVKTSSGGYNANDRNAPHLCPSILSTLEIFVDFILYCIEYII